MTVFYINNDKNVDDGEFADKFDLAKFIDGRSDTSAETIERIRKAIDDEEI